MIKIVHVITDLDIGGAETMLSRLVIGMDRKRFSNSVVSLTQPGHFGHVIQSNEIRVSSLLMQRSIPNPIGIWRLTRFLQQERPDIVQTWLYHADLLGLLVGKLAHIPIIVWNVRCAEMDMTRYSTLSRFVRYLLIKLSFLPKMILCNSNAGQRYHEGLGYRALRWTIIPNGVDLNNYLPDSEAYTKLRLDLGLSNDSLLIGLIARFDPMKDHVTFLRGAEKILKAYPDIHFVLAGAGISSQNSKLSETIRACHLEKNIHLLGERVDVPRVLAGLDILASSSYGESFPNVIAEAMACGVPCVATDVGDSSWIVGETGRVVLPKNPEALATALGEIVALGKQERCRLGLAARQRIMENFDIERIVSRYEQCYEALVAGS